MEFKVFVKDIQLTPALQNYIEKRMSKPDHMLKKHEDLLSPADFRIQKEGGIYKVEITAHFKKFNKIIKVEEKDGDLYEAIDNVTDSLERKIRKLKTRIQEHDSKKQFNEAIKDTEENEEQSRIRKTKRYDLSMMPAEEALLQAELLGHNFFVFRNADTNEVNVVYKRNNGSFGLIEFVE
ncbi:ribosome hibernation-promoting factor, HPF/YfiA family [Geotoga petraea]|jgi:putative sigma-54 modulation protein|uniref:Ribosome hibernation promoting factor n=1 Tax=Geotoga petraea TaxID=28234 RepID=A0A1G6LK48_9BACT|nr:ribosome-associated translation inhibitor RaiA [Geotoga petraea]MDK2945818.1 putative sigma-54 modulation protein [Geotoga sp.]TGG87620.1 ribosome-associated translation inhibitor RaiA [Geotoga petraea]SDC43611.1 SSU ribosomal protein S30P /sigma 54 modulation protein [Geotoga petraea]